METSPTHPTHLTYPTHPDLPDPPDLTRFYQVQVPAGVFHDERVGIRFVGGARERAVIEIAEVHLAACVFGDRRCERDAEPRNRLARGVPRAAIADVREVYRM